MIEKIILKISMYLIGLVTIYYIFEIITGKPYVPPYPILVSGLLIEFWALVWISGMLKVVGRKVKPNI